MAKTRISKNEISEKDIFGNIQESAKSAKAEVLLLETTLKTVVETAKRVKSGAATGTPKDNSSIKERNELLAKSNSLANAKVGVEKKLQKARLDAIRLEKQREKAFDRFEKKRQKEIKDTIRSRKAIIDEANAFKTLSSQVNSAQARFKRLAAQYGENDKRAIKALATFRKLDNRLRSINKTARDGRRDVGRYGLALQGVGSSLKTLLIGGGIATVIFGVARAFGNAFERVREFDKEMQNLAGISGIARKNLGGVEKAIKRVAGGSTRTSNEVAKLATTLFALGKTESEVKKLLKPTNDLSIALGATSDEAGELLVSTLNAFGKSANEGERFADIIAKIRTSTSLDFERIKDALGFVAPTANALNLSLEETGALIGVLQDNGIKSARAGRLLSSSFIKIAKEGKTLEGSLDRINAAQERGATGAELLRIAEKDFGVQSAALGLVLANNRDRTAELTAEFENLSEGALEKLTQEQLKSMDAQLKILDSTWEKFILSLDSGDSAIGNATRSITTFLGEAITGFMNLDLIAKSTFRGLIDFRDEELSRTLDGGWVTETGVNINKIRKEFDKIPLEKIAKNVDKVREGWIDLLGEDRTDAALLFTQYIRERTDAEKELSLETEKNTEINIGNSKSKETNASKTRTLTGLIEKQSKVVADLNSEIKQAQTEELIIKLSLELDAEKEELSRLKRIVSSSLEEIQKIELDLIEDTTEKTIEKEIEKSNRLIKQIETNSRAETAVKEKLIAQENKRLDGFVQEQQIKELKSSIRFESDLAKAKVEQSRTGFKTEEDFEKEKAEQFKAIKRNQLQAELDLLQFYSREEDKLRVEQLKAELEGLNSFEKAIEFNYDIIEKAIKFTEALVVKSFDKRIELSEKEEQAYRDNLDEFKQAARDGNITAKESLAEEQQLAEEAQVKQEKLEQKKQNILLVSAILSAFNSELAAGKDAGQALAGAITSTTVLTQFASALPAFLEGTENTGNHGEGVDGKGGFHAILHPNERVLTKEQNEKIGNVSNEEVAGIVENHRLGYLIGSDMSVTAAVVDMSGLENRLESIEKAIINKPETNIELGAITQESFNIVQRTKKGNRITSNNFKVKR
jgi:hypothetical protein